MESLQFFENTKRLIDSEDIRGRYNCHSFATAAISSYICGFSCPELDAGEASMQIIKLLSLNPNRNSDLNSIYNLANDNLISYHVFQKRSAEPGLDFNITRIYHSGIFLPKSAQMQNPSSYNEFLVVEREAHSKVVKDRHADARARWLLKGEEAALGMYQNMIGNSVGIKTLEYALRKYNKPNATTMFFVWS